MVNQLLKFDVKGSLDLTVAMLVSATFKPRASKNIGHNEWTSFFATIIPKFINYLYRSEMLLKCFDYHTHVIMPNLRVSKTLKSI